MEISNFGYGVIALMVISTIGAYLGTRPRKVKKNSKYSLRCIRWILVPGQSVVRIDCMMYGYIPHWHTHMNAHTVSGSIVFNLWWEEADRARRARA